MNIERLKLGEIVPYKKNNRKHSELQIERIARSIQEFGFNQPICIDENNEILVGHGRLLAAQKLGLKDAPIVRLNDLTEEQKRAYRILDNKLQNDSEWDFDSLSEELDFLQSNGVDLESWGLDDLKSLFPEQEMEVSEDDGPGDLPKETYIKLGDLIELGKHRVLCGDSTSEEDVSTLAQQEQIESCITDPPYGVGYVGKTSEALTIDGDANCDVAVQGTKNATASIIPGGAIYICFPAEEIKALGDIWAEDNKLQSMLVWVKQSIVMGRKDYHYKHEPIWYGWREGAAHRFRGDRTNATVLEFERPSRNTEHPTMKPIELFAELIKNSTSRGEKIIDPFLGSGTTLIAADQLNRICYGMEISPNYCQVILERYKKYCEQNGKKFECKINGEAFIPPSDEKEAS